MTKNKLVLYDIPMSFHSLYDTVVLKVENLMKQIKLYFDNEGFITSEIESDDKYYRLDIGIPNFVTKISFKITYTTSTIYIYYGVCRVGGIHVYGASSSLKFDNTYTMCINYFVNDSFIGVLCHNCQDKCSAGFGSYASFICKSEVNKEYYRCGYSTAQAINDSDTGTSYKLTGVANALNINKAILNKVFVSSGYLRNVYVISFPTRIQPIGSDTLLGGIIVNLKGYGNFFCFTGTTGKINLYAVKMDDEETTETVTTTPTDESQTT